MKTKLMIPVCDKCSDVPDVTIGKWFWGHGCVCGGQFRDKPMSLTVFSSRIGAQAKMANARNTGFVRQTENGWWVYIPRTKI